MMPSHVMRCVVVFGIGSFAIPAFATDVSERLAVTGLSRVDQDFPFQGEYAGLIVDESNCYRRVGLQVVAMGDGEFLGRVYGGGLPGAGWWGGSTTNRYDGHQHDYAVHLNGPGRSIEVKSDSATLRGKRGQTLGILAKVHRTSPTMGLPAPWYATTLFNGTGTGHFRNGRMTEDGLLMVGTQLKRLHRDYRMHLEFRLPYMPNARGQGRANSGVYLQSRYEVQILDSFGLEGKDNECGGLYRFRQPDVNMCLPPLDWQTYDIEFRAPRFDADGNKYRHASITVWHNGVIVHNHVAVTRKTGGGSQEGPKLLPIKLQDHGNPVVFRNIWIVDYARPAVGPNDFYTRTVCNRRGVFLRRLFGGRLFGH